ncbi:Enzymatic polyprotein [Merluccius polli]|uniref:ribonuclease H n=1 Tax=Merluccius polli TaxID=89951 RepID=A0AA47M039_MERPO|nr:Enzymatic polyprotein [Merluccius polli]
MNGVLLHSYSTAPKQQPQKKTTKLNPLPACATELIIHTLTVQWDHKDPGRAPKYVTRPPMAKKCKDALIEERVIRKIEEPTEWVNAVVIVEKPNGDLRLCIDPKYLNKGIQREHYKLPTKSDKTSAMSGACYFSKLDASSGFYQIVLDEESSKIGTFNTPFGRHCFLASLRNTKNTTEEDVQIHVDSIRAQMPVSNTKWAEIARQTLKDDRGE